MSPLRLSHLQFITLVKFRDSRFQNKMQTIFMAYVELSAFNGYKHLVTSP